MGEWGLRGSVEMGKAEEEQVVGAVPASLETPEGNAAGVCPPCRSVGKIVSLRCVAVLLVGASVMLSAVFWLPPFLRRGSGFGSPDSNPQYRADVVASFKLQRPISLLNANAAKLQYDIFDEIGVPNTIVSVLYLEPLGTNSTNVVFGIWPYPKNSNISTGLSILKSSFVSLVLKQSTLHLTTPLFGSSYFFQILKFPGGITIAPPQHAFLLQEEHMLFNFTLNFPIYQVQDKIDELKDQMKSSLHIKSYEVLFVRLTNINGSTVVPPTVVQTSIVLAVGNNQASGPRLKQLAQNIRNSSAGNLGLNNTIFGRVKQIRLSSFLQHSLSSGGSSLSPTPAPQPGVDPHFHRHSNHHHHQHHSDVHAAPAPALAPKPIFTHFSPPPSGCRFGFSSNPKRKPELVPVPAPAESPHSSVSQSHEVAPAPSPHLHRKSHVPSVVFSHSRPPSERVIDIKPQDRGPSISPSTSSSFVVGQTITCLVFGLFVHLWFIDSNGGGILFSGTSPCCSERIGLHQPQRLIQNTR